MKRTSLPLLLASLLAGLIGCGVDDAPDDRLPHDTGPCEHVAHVAAGDVKASCTPDGDAYACTCELDRRELGGPLPTEGTSWIDPDGTYEPLDVAFRQEGFCALPDAARTAAVIDGCPFDPICLVSFREDQGCRVPVFCSDDVERALTCSPNGAVDACDCTPNAPGGTFELAGVCAAIDGAMEGGSLNPGPVMQIINEHCDYPGEF